MVCTPHCPITLLTGATTTNSCTNHYKSIFTPETTNINKYLCTLPSSLPFRSFLSSKINEPLCLLRSPSHIFKHICLKAIMFGKFSTKRKKILKIIIICFLLLHHIHIRSTWDVRLIFILPQRSPYLLPKTTTTPTPEHMSR